MNPDSNEKASSRERKFGGVARWQFTIAAVGSIFVVVWFAGQNTSFAIFAAVLGIINAVLAVINWRNWLKKSETEKAPLRFWDQLKTKEISIPLKRDDYNQARRVLGMNLSIAAIAALYTLCGIGFLFIPAVSLALRIVGITTGAVAAWVLWHCGRQFLAAAKSLTCPGCKNLLTSQGESVLDTGCCRKCKRPILID
jgi:hypothetical protein